jgi:hypothetical protein
LATRTIDNSNNSLRKSACEPGTRTQHESQFQNSEDRRIYLLRSYRSMQVEQETVTLDNVLQLEHTDWYSVSSSCSLSVNQTSTLGQTGASALGLANPGWSCDIHLSRPVHSGRHPCQREPVPHSSRCVTAAVSSSVCITPRIRS